MEKVITIAQACEMLMVSQRTFYRMMDAGIFNSDNSWMSGFKNSKRVVLLSAVEGFLTQQKQSQQ